MLKQLGRSQTRGEGSKPTCCPALAASDMVNVQAKRSSVTT